MYRWLLCWRYLRTRYIALASVVSVMLGVATMIIVNAVMDGFTTEMQGRMHGILSDIIIESHNSMGLPNHAAFEFRIREVLGEDVEGITTVVHVPAMVTFNHRGEPFTRQINLIGIDTKTYSQVSDFSKFLLHPENQRSLSFALRESGYAPGRQDFPESGWTHRRRAAAAEKAMLQLRSQLDAERERNESLRMQMARATQESDTPPASSPSATSSSSPSAPINTVPPAQFASEASGDGSDATSGNEFTANGALATELMMPSAPVGLAGSESLAATGQTPAIDTKPAYDAVIDDSDRGRIFDAATQQHDGIVLGISIGATRYRDLAGNVSDYYYLQPGDDVWVTFPSAGDKPRALNEKFTVVDFYESQMSDYDSTFAFVPLDRLQQYRGMVDPASGLRSVSSIQLKLREGADLNAARDALRAAFPLESMVQVNSWRDLQGTLLAAVQMETTILNILLFLIIAVAGFGILATFFMIVVEKTKDIGVLKSLGASGTGVASIFLGYGVLLGAVGSGVGTAAGLIFVSNINTIADGLEILTGQEVFDPTVYYFDHIPTIINPITVISVIIGALLIAVSASVLPAIRAARMHPVEALRYE